MKLTRKILRTLLHIFGKCNILWTVLLFFAFLYFTSRTMTIIVNLLSVTPHLKDMTQKSLSFEANLNGSMTDLNDYFPMKITLNSLFVDGPFPLNSTLMRELKKHVEDVVNHNCGSNTETIIFIISEPTHFLLRAQIRTSFGRNRAKHRYHQHYGKSYTHCLLFSIGYRSDFLLNQQVDFEAFTFNDILRLPVLDTYRKTAHKIILTLHLLDNLSLALKFILKADDDVFIKINKVIPYLHNLSQNSVFVGQVLKNIVAIRNPKNKWHVSEEDYPDKVYKPYMLGWCYVFRRSIVPGLVALHYQIPLIPMEDIHISHLVTRAGYILSNSPMFEYCRLYDCKKKFLMDIGKNLLVRQLVLDEYKDEYV